MKESEEPRIEGILTKLGQVAVSQQLAERADSLFEKHLLEHGRALKTAPGQGMAPRRSFWPTLGKAFAGVAAACVLAVLVWWAASNGHSIVPSAYAELAEAVRSTRATEWIYARRGPEDKWFETWRSLKPVRLIERSHNGNVRYITPESNRRTSYDPSKQIVTIEFAPSQPDALEADSFLHAFMERIKHWERDGAEISREAKAVAGQNVILFTINVPEKTEGHVRRQRETIRATVDAERQRIIRIEREGTNFAGRPYASVKDLQYPRSGPEDIYALGVPRDARVVDLTPTTESRELKEAVQGAAESFVPQYYAVICRRLKEFQGGTPHVRASVTLMSYRNGLERSQIYELSPPDGTSYAESLTYHEKLWETLPAQDMAALEAWAAKRSPSKVTFNDGKMATRIWLSEDGEVREDSRPTDRPAGLNFHCLPIVLKNCSMLKPAAGKWGRLVGMDSYYSVYERWYFNPERDYICEFYETGGDPDRTGTYLLQMHGEGWFARTEVLDYARTPGGHWYPKEIRQTQDIVGDQDTQITVIHIDAEREVPEPFLDPESVTEEMFK